MPSLAETGVEFGEFRVSLDPKFRNQLEQLVEQTKWSAQLDLLRTILSETPKSVPIRKSKISLTIKELEKKLGEVVRVTI